MASRRRVVEPAQRRRKPPTTPEQEEQELIGMAYDLAKRQLIDGTASSQVQTHFLRLGSSREMLEQERLRHENELTQVKIRAAEDMRRRESLFERAINAMRSYRGEETDYEDEEDAA